VGDELTRPVRDARRFPSTELYRGLHARRDSSGVVYLSCKGHFPSPRAYPNVRFATFASLYTGPHLSLSLHSLEVGDHRSAPFVQLGALHLTQGTLHRIAHPTPPHQRCPNWGWAEVHKACWAPGVIIAWQRAHTVLPCTLMCLRALSAIAASEVVNCTKPKPLDLRVMLSLTTCLASPSELLASPSALSA
jgi:hypothetical protein